MKKRRHMKDKSKTRKQLIEFAELYKTIRNKMRDDIGKITSFELNALLQILKALKDLKIDLTIENKR